MSKIIKVSNNRIVRNTFKNNILLAKEILNSTRCMNFSAPNGILKFTDIKDSDYDDGDGYGEEDLMVANAIAGGLNDGLKENKGKHTNGKKLRKSFPLYKWVEIVRCDVYNADDLDSGMEDIKAVGRNIYYAEFEYETNGRLYINTRVEYEEFKEKE